MTSLYLLDAIGRIDDDLVTEATAVPRRRNALWLRYGAAAAALVLCVGLAGLAVRLERKGSPAPAMYAAESGTDPASASPSAESVPGASHSNQSGSSGSDFAVRGDVFRPILWVGGTAYHITGFEENLPDGCTPLGALALAPADPADSDAAADAPPLVNDESLVGRRVWQAENGELFIVLDSGCVRAVPTNPAEN